MGFVTSKTSVTRHGAFALERTPPAVLRAQGTGVSAMIGQFPWGPTGSIIEPSSPAERANLLAPPGMSRTGSGYLSTIRKAFPMLKLVRILGTAAAAASAMLTAAGPVNIVRVDAKYKGVAGNSIVCTVSAATDGDANHFNLTVSVTGASGTTEDIFQNLNYSGTGADSAPVFTSALLTGAIVKQTSGRPTNGSYTMTTGADGTVDSAAYIGTAGTGDKGLALIEGDPTVRRVFADDPGNSLRAAVNAGLQAHQTLMGDRVAFMNGDSGLSVSATRTDVANYRSTRVVYADPWVYIYDDTDGSKRLVPPASFLAAVHAQLSPSTSIAWKDAKVIAMLEGIRGLESDRGASVGGHTTAGIATIIREEDGGYSIEAGVVTYAANDPAKRNLTRTTMGDYIALAFTKSVRSRVDAPNVAVNQALIVAALDSFCRDLVENASTDPDNLPHLVAYEIGEISAVNTPTSIAAGEFVVPLDAETSSGMEKIFLSIRYGEGVITAQAA